MTLLPLVGIVFMIPFLPLFLDFDGIMFERRCDILYLLFQAIGAAGGALAIMEFIPEKYKHMIGGPSLQVDVHTGAIAETILSFGITFAVLLIILRGPRRLLAKTFLLALATISFVVAGSKYTGPAMNPAIAFGWAYMYSSHNTWDHIYVYWISSFVGALSAALLFRSIFPPPRPQKKKQKKA